jgi:hypothetical protein
MSMTHESDPAAEAPLDRAFIERERNRLASRALSLLVLLNGSAALILLAILARAPEGTVPGKVAAAMLFFSAGAVAALLSAFLAYINRTVRMDALTAPRRARLRRGLRIFAILCVIGSGACFLTGMNMVGTSSAERSSSHPKGPKEKSPAKAPSERAQTLQDISTAAGERQL